MTRPPIAPPMAPPRQPFTLRTVLIGTLALGAVYAYMAIGYGIARDLHGLRLWAFNLGLLGVAAGLLAGLLRRAALTRIAWGVAVAVLAGNLVADSVRQSQRQAAWGKERVAANEALLASAQSRLACENGDIVTLQYFHRAADDWKVLSAVVVPGDRTRHGDALGSATGAYRPPDDKAIRAYVLRTGGRCGNGEYPSLDALFARLQAHHAQEMHKYPHKPPPGLPKGTAPK